MKVEQRYVIKFFVEEGMKGVEAIGRLNEPMIGTPSSERKCITGSRR
jgi:hypothetical protein